MGVLGGVHVNNRCAALSDVPHRIGKFPGARKMGLPLKDAVERFLTLKYSERIKSGSLTKADIWREDKRLYEAMKDYKKTYGELPFDIPSERDIVQRDLQQFFKMGVESLTPRQRLSVRKKHRQIRKPPDRTP